MPTYHSGFHRPHRLVLRIMRDVGRTMEKLVDPMARICTHGGTPVGPRVRFAVYDDQVNWILNFTKAHPHMVFPISLIKAPGLQSLMASSRHSRVVRISFLDSSSISPTA